MAITTSLSASLLTACALRPPVNDGHTTTPSSASPTPATTGATPAKVTDLLPLTHHQLNAAIRLAADFTTAYGSHRYDQSAQAYLARLRPITTPELYAALARAASTPSIQTQRTRDHETATAHATATKIRTIGPSSLIVLVDLHQDITTTAGRHQRTQHLAVTTIKTGQNDWDIHDIQPANAGNAGDTDASAE
ncbi:hypothetical protein E1264_09135 [Actinomadura sp. KC216]|uniref:hypothetical protein n=1 Tax=Actinomadura sp. KC216 TaxID=2530370 RepID=UPI00104EF0A7|nr:hypothetical protein [Actinomadura sp. KC216]TDB89124.1 hypothetical protein E1264_09135 [Actinomadura sp. KC216]